VDPVPGPLFLRKSGSAGNRARVHWIWGQELWPLDHRGSLDRLRSKSYGVFVCLFVCRLETFAQSLPIILSCFWTCATKSSFGFDTGNFTWSSAKVNIFKGAFFGLYDPFISSVLFFSSPVFRCNSAVFGTVVIYDTTLLLGVDVGNFEFSLNLIFIWQHVFIIVTFLPFSVCNGNVSSYIVWR
jgi:hypothetical protein